MGRITASLTDKAKQTVLYCAIQTRGPALVARPTPARFDPAPARPSLSCQRRQAPSDLGISLRTLYRDIATLQAQGAIIDGAPGLGYVLRPGFLLPPLMLSQDEIEALALGSRWVADRGDARLGQAASDAIS